ncbi:MAG: ornithine carbamoyltransferase [Verrucomicrobiales bacterium]
MNHLLSLEQLTASEIREILSLAARLKKQRGTPAGARHQPLRGQTWAMIFTKASTRTRVSFEVGVRELGGDVFFLSPADSQLGRGEPIKDTARVFGRIAHGAIIRTFAQQDVVDFAHFSGLPTINALTDEEHPCQVLADLQTMQEKLAGWKDRKVVFMGDGDNNMARSWMWAAERLGFDLVICAPKKYQPKPAYLARFRMGRVTCEADPAKAAGGADVLYTDVFVSMGQEAEGAKRLKDLRAYQINEELVKVAGPQAIVMHCLPAYRGKEITESVLEAHAGTIFQEAENRLHAQKAVMSLLARS